MRRDPHSYADDEQPRVVRLVWRARVDFPSRTIEADARLILSDMIMLSGPLDLDTRDLTILEVSDGEGRALAFSLGPPDPIRGARLRVELLPGTRAVAIRYRTSPQASALHWLPAEATLSRRFPFVYSQCQAIHARSLVPLPDTPTGRITLDIELTVPSEVRGLAAAIFVGREERGALAVEKFVLERAVPPYLLAIAVGDLAARDVGPRSRVWADPALLERAAWELAPVEELLAAAERLYGPYPWERFDLLLLPSAFPYGGMENPTLAFFSPSLLAGDRSLFTLVAHELAHAWTGSLVTAATAEHFWINEGFTVYAERRLIEERDGREAAALAAALGRRALDDAHASLVARPELARLRSSLDGIHPDEAASAIPYEKGYLLLRALEEAVGRARLDALLRAFVNRFTDRSITTDEVAAFLDERLPEAMARVDLRRWLAEAGLPAGAPRSPSVRLDELRALAVRGGTPDRLTPLEWQVFLDALPRPLGVARAAALDERFTLTRSTNHEVLVAWLPTAIAADYAPAVARAVDLVGETGRMKHLKPLYLALAARPQSRAEVGPLYRSHRERYHPIARHVLETILRTQGIAVAVANPVGLRRR